MNRTIEFLLALLSIIITLPFLIFFGFLILVFSGKPIIFVQDRVGMNGKLFEIYKFRTMRTSANQNQSKISTYKDKRVTHIGTIFHPHPKPLGNKKSWLAYALKPIGQIQLDQGHKL